MTEQERPDLLKAWYMAHAEQPYRDEAAVAKNTLATLYTYKRTRNIRRQRKDAWQKVTQNTQKAEEAAEYTEYLIDLFRSFTISEEIKNLYNDTVIRAFSMERSDLADNIVSLFDKSPEDMYEEYRTDQWHKRYLPLARMMEEVALAVVSGKEEERTARLSGSSDTIANWNPYGGIKSEAVAQAQEALEADMTIVKDAYALLGLGDKVEDVPEFLGFFEDEKLEIRKYPLPGLEGVNLKFMFYSAQDGVDPEGMAQHIPSHVDLKISGRTGNGV